MITRDEYPVPAAVVMFVTMLAPTSRPFSAVVVSVPLSLLVDVPVEPIPPSNGFAGSSPRYSATRTSANDAAPLKVTVTVFAWAAAPTMFAA